MNEQLEYLMRPYGIMRRTVYLEKGWYKDAIGAMLGVMKETGKIVALLPEKCLVTAIMTLKLEKEER